MRKLLVALDDDLDKVLRGVPNQSLVVREALKLYMCDISTETVEGMRASYSIIGKKLKEIEDILNFIARKVQ